MSDWIEPLPCPFCGKAPLLESSGERGLGVMIQCITPDCVNPHVSYYGANVAVKVWNRRAPVSDERMMANYKTSTDGDRK